MIFDTPLKESKGFIRTSQRTLTDINAAIIRLEPKKVTGSGTIINLSDGGCSFSTDAALQVDDEIELLILLYEKNVERECTIHGTIRSTRTVKSKDEITNYGIQCVDDDRKILEEITKFVESQKAGNEHKTTK